MHATTIMEKLNTDKFALHREDKVDEDGSVVVRLDLDSRGQVGGTYGSVWVYKYRAVRDGDTGRMIPEGERWLPAGIAWGGTFDGDQYRPGVSGEGPTSVGKAEAFAHLILKAVEIAEHLDETSE